MQKACRFSSCKALEKERRPTKPRKNEIKIPYCSRQQNSRICTQTAPRADPDLPVPLFCKSGIFYICIRMLPMQTFQVPPAFLNGLSRFCKWYKRKAYWLFPVHPWIILKVMVNSRLKKFPLSPLLGERQSLLSHLPTENLQRGRTLEREHEWKGIYTPLQQFRTFSSEKLHREKWQWGIFQHMNCFIQECL